MSLDPTRFQANEYLNTDWTLTVEAGTSLEDVMNPAFLANVADKLHMYDHIRVRVDTGEWYAELMVLDCGRTWAKTLKLCEHKLVKEDDGASEVTDSQYTVKFLGPHKKFCAIRKSDNSAIKEGCASKQEAHAWLAQYVMTM